MSVAQQAPLGASFAFPEDFVDMGETPSSGYYKGSVTPSGLPWDTYNYCNAPTSGAEHYRVPPQAENGRARLVHLVYVQRHQKRTPDNLAPMENRLNPAEGWDCVGSDYSLYNYGRGAGGAAQSSSASIYHETDIPNWHPFLDRIWNGSCESGQMTAGGLEDAIHHGQRLASIYGPGEIAPLFSSAEGIGSGELYVRTSPEERTFQVAGGLLAGMGYTADFAVHAQPSTIDNIVPSYSCSYADELRKQIEEEADWKAHLAEQSELFSSVTSALGTRGDAGWQSWIDHSFDFLASRQCHGHELPSNLTQQVADRVYAEGDWEYNYIWNTSPRADDYVRYSFGGFTTELSRLLRSLLARPPAAAAGAAGGQDRSGDAKMHLFVGHDGTMVRLYKTLAQQGTIRWPAMGSDLAIEVWQRNEDDQRFVRMQAYGHTFNTTSPELSGSGNGGGPVDWTPLETVVDYLSSRVPADLAQRCSA